MDIDPKSALEVMVKATLLAQLDKDQGRIIERLVEESLKKKDGYGYDSKTLLDQELGYTIREAVRKIVAEIVETRKDQLMEAVKAKLNDAFFDKVIEKLSVGLSEKLEIAFTIKSSDY